MNQKYMSDLTVNQNAIIAGFTDEALSLKLLEMGILPGIEFTLSHIAPMGDPLAIKIGEYHLALRKDEAGTILVV